MYEFEMLHVIEFQFNSLMLLLTLRNLPLKRRRKEESTLQYKKKQYDARKLRLMTLAQGQFEEYSKEEFADSINVRVTVKITCILFKSKDRLCHVQRGSTIVITGKKRRC